MPHTTFTASVAALLLDVSWKSLLVFAPAGLAALALRRASAAARHALWLLTLAALLCLPLFCALLPRWTAPVLPAALRPVSHVLPTARPAPPREQAHVVAAPNTAPAPTASAPTAPVPMASAPPTLPSAALPSAPALPPAPALPRPTVRPPPLPVRPAFSLADEVCLAWLIGILLVTGRTLLGLAAASRLTRCCRPVTAGPLTEAAEAARRTLDLTRPLSIHVGSVAVPMTCGVRRPVVLLPEGATDWPEGRLRAVLLHEAAHVQRWDWATMLLARCVCALYWPHPLAWFCAYRLRVEAEGACDDRVLTHGGIPAPDYAAHLLEIVRALSARRPASVATVAMASRPEVSARLRTILDAHQARKGVSRRGLTLAGLTALALLAPLAALRPVNRTGISVPGALNSDASSSVQTVSWVTTTHFFDLHGKPTSSPSSMTTWVQRDPPAVAESMPPYSSIINQKGVFCHIANGLADTARAFPLLDGAKSVADEVERRIQYCTGFPDEENSQSGNMKYTFTPWQESRAVLDGQPVRLLTRNATMAIFTPVKTHWVNHTQRWVDANTGHLLRSETDIVSSGFPDKQVMVTSHFRYNQPLPAGVFEGAPMTTLPPSVGFRRYVSHPLPDGTRYTFLYPAYFAKVRPSFPDTKNWFDCAHLDCIGTPPVPWTPVRGGTVIASRSHGAGGTSWPAPHEEFISVVVGHPGDVTFPPGQRSIRAELAQWVGANGSHHAFSLTDARTHLRFLVIHEDRYIPELFKQTDPVITGSFQILPPGAAVPSATADFIHEKARADQQASSSNLRHIGLGLMEYAQDHKEHFPDAAHWMDEIIPYLVPRQLTGAARRQCIAALFHDPAAPAGWTWSYAYNRALSSLSLAKVDLPASTIAVFESTVGTRNASDGGQSVPKPGWHTGGSDYLFTDGHAKYFRSSQGLPQFSPTDPNKPVAIPVTGRIYERKTLRPVTDSSVIFSHSSQTITPGSLWPSSFTHKTGRFECALYPGKNYLMVLEGGRYVSLSRQPMLYETSGGTARVTTMGPVAHQYIINLVMPSAYALAGESHPDKAAGRDVMAFVPVSRATGIRFFAALPHTKD